MQTVTSVSGGQTSAFLAANYPTDFNVFALVRVSDPACKYPDAKIRQMVSDRIGCEFLGTVEDDLIITTILELEQFIGRPIQWVTGPTFEQVIFEHGGWLPNKMHRYCTTFLKLVPIFEWWLSLHIDPVQMNIGYRASEEKRVQKMAKRLNSDGLLEMKYARSLHIAGRHKGLNFWESIPWQLPNYPLIADRVYRSQIVEFWKNRNVRFAPLNNCAGCFHRNPVLLRQMFDLQPTKMEWFRKMEVLKNKSGSLGTWRSDVSYSQIANHNPQVSIDFGDFSDCDSGFCEVD